MKVDYAEESPVRKSLTFEIEADVVDREIAERAKEYARTAKLPGFRPGKIPAEVIRRRFHHQVLEDVAEKLVNKAVREALDDRGLKPLDSPKISELKIEEKQPLSFKAVFETLPIVELPEYKGLSVKVKAAAVTEEQVDKEIDALRDNAARYDPVEGRPVRAGDFAVLDLSWRPQEGGEGGREENALMEVGADDTHPDLNAALLGTSVGDHKDVTIAYAADYRTKALAGRTVAYSFTVKAIKNKVVPEADDEFAKDLGEFGSLAELRAKVRERMQQLEERRVDRDAKQALMDALGQRVSFEVPEVLMERHLDARLEDAVRALAMQGIDPRQSGVDWKAWREAQKDEAARAARVDIVLDEIARRENVGVAPEELDAEVARIAERMRKPVESVRARLEKDGDIFAIRARIREEKTLDLLKAGARMDFE